MTTSDATHEQPLLVSDHDGVRTLTLNRPAARNAVNLALATAIDAALTEFDERRDLSVAVLAANGTTFCAGMDLKAFLRGERPITPRRGFAGIVQEPPRKPIIAAVDGPAVAGGFEIVLACDMIVAAENAFFALPEVKRGLVAAGGGLLRLPGRLPYHLAMELALTGKTISAVDAERLGLVNKLVAPGTAVAAATELAAEVAACGPLAVAATKQILQDSPGWPAGEAFARQSELTEPVRSSADAVEGARAFTEKRPPAWTGS
ncbi:crotonase/enoyl-CoA hydratase family protein [Geodermatophilus sabuli]|uniref:Enoyl-CoA hydratase n=1 Tax=Geodermatophilus sabuli TaxID=1564158 RepID=A0A285EAL8_9ACTN|nr:crotonase/enoyl-CoA hydratase family protein [Geodermatophilus sabuli]MBB3085541.1 enoyl-CoA hydratase [Geodermatophilus sabuli]SNX96037.1 enoyl-CoA hydratase [Geodermatophilus sabuli]